MVATTVRHLVTVQAIENDMATDGASLPLPDVIKASICRDIVTFVHEVYSPYRTSCIWEHVSWRSHVCSYQDMALRHRAVNVTQKRHAMVSAIAAADVTSLVIARGHRIEEILELPLVVSDSTEALEKTNATIKILKQIGAYPRR
ncbi:unnamed protein product [Fraxinus pennsylvanica]|uniref:Uncharacterized protein n=1 Tax=Fraxinus pennsylvanica TaxID=56036 RepID=A0AAD2A2C1_9LAMI|nr:unnamed protein product [Fraxinus pennsylvanica]